MGMDVYDILANAVQAVYAEREASEDARAAKIRAAFARSGHGEELDKLLAAMEQPAHRKGK